MQSAYGLYNIKKEDKDCTDIIYVSVEEVPNKSIEIKDTGVIEHPMRYVYRVKGLHGIYSPWSFGNDSIIESFIPYFKLRTKQLPALRNDGINYFK